MYVDMLHIINSVWDRGMELLVISMKRSATVLKRDMSTTVMNSLFAFPFVILREWQTNNIIRNNGMAHMSK